MLRNKKKERKKWHISKSSKVEILSPRGSMDGPQKESRIICKCKHI